jgi:uncharacterized protein
MPNWRRCLLGRDTMRGTRSTLLSLAFILISCSPFRPGAPARPVKLSRDAAEKARKEIEKERTDSKEWLCNSPTSYLAAVERMDFNGKKTLTVGSAADNDLQLSAPDIEPHHLRITVDGDQFRVECIDSAACFKIKESVRKQATVAPSYIQVGRFTLRLSHQRFPALIVFDPQSPHLKEYKGLSYFPVDLAFRYELPLYHYKKRQEIAIGSTRGNQRGAELIGWVEFLVGEAPCKLEVTRFMEPGTAEDQVEILFQDATTKNETYPLGRYVDLKRLENGMYLLDFNLAYNPACAFSNYYNCPIPPKSNNLKVPIRAGETDPHYHHPRSKDLNSPAMALAAQWAMCLSADLPEALYASHRFALNPGGRK